MRVHFSPLYIEVLPDGHEYMLTKHFYATIEKQKFIVPSGFVTDFASVPRGLWNIFPPHGKYSKAAVLHDYLYRCSVLSRKRCDEIFLTCMEVLGVPYMQRYAMYWGVRMFGGLCR